MFFVKKHLYFVERCVMLIFVVRKYNKLWRVSEMSAEGVTQLVYVKEELQKQLPISQAKGQG